MIQVVNPSKTPTKAASARLFVLALLLVLANKAGCQRAKRVGYLIAMKAAVPGLSGRYQPLQKFIDDRR